ncbi:MAG: caspase family protein [Hyphomicrobiaceae bacterium]|jgi:hypothetical protein
MHLLLLLVFLIASASPAWAQKRVALVIGNGAYAKVTPLPNPARDSVAIETMLKSAGFDSVWRHTDLSASAMRRALRDFSDQTRDADVAVVFFAGHGIEVNGTNYLIPVDAVLERDIDVEDEAVPLDRVSQVLFQTRRLRLIILDACRDNPFSRSMRRTVTGRSIGRGLARVDVLTSDTLVAYAAKAGSTADDGEGTNSPYTSALIKHLATPGLDVRLALGRVRDEVLKTTRNKQEPFVYGSLGGNEISLVPHRRALREWQDVKNTRSIKVLESFIQRHRNDTVYSMLAQERLEELRREEQRKALEAAAKAEAERSARDAAAKAEAERKAREAAKVEADRKAREAARAEADRKAREAANAESERKARETAAKAEVERKAREATKAEADKKEREAAAQAETERKAREKTATVGPAQPRNEEVGKPTAGAPPPTQTQKKEVKNRPDASRYSVKVWPPGTIPTGQTKTTSTEFGVLTCIGGPNPSARRDCRWQ